MWSYRWGRVARKFIARRDVIVRSAGFGLLGWGRVVVLVVCLAFVPRRKRVVSHAARRNAQTEFICGGGCCSVWSVG